MSKENMKRFFEKAAATPVLAEKLGAVQKQYMEQLAALAGENGFELTSEDFVEEIQPLGDEIVENAAGGWNPLMESDLVKTAKKLQELGLDICD